MNAKHQIRNTLLNLISSQLTPEGLDWVLQKEELLSKGHNNIDFMLTLAMVPKHVGKNSCLFSPHQLTLANSVVEGWQPNHDRIDQLVRVYFLLQLPSVHQTTYQQTLELLFTTSETNELVALCRGLPLFPYPETTLVGFAKEALRHNVIDVFKAVACFNPFPSTYFNDDAFNQMVLKAAFNNVPLSSIYKLEFRTNTKLQQMMSDFVAERRAAGRKVETTWLELSTGCLAY